MPDDSPMHASIPRHRVLVTDDDPTIRAILAASLMDDFDVIEAENGLVCLEKLAAEQPALVLLDLEMPGMDGYETCRLLRETHHMPVVVVSSHGKLEERLDAFAAGADDFICKPFDGEELAVKVGRLIAMHDQLSEARRAEETLREFTLDLVRGIGRADVLLNFMRENIHCTDYESLATSLIQGSSEYCVTCHAQVRHDDTAITLTPAGIASPLEEAVFAQVASLGSAFRFGRRVILNRGDVSLLVLRLPDDEVLAGQVLSRLEVLTEFAAAVAETIQVRRESAERAEALQSGTADSYTAIEELREKYRDQQANTRFLLQKLVEDIEGSYFGLGLTSRQEAQISDTLRERSEDILRLFELQDEFEEKFAAILESLQPKGDNSAPQIWLF